MQGAEGVGKPRPGRFRWGCNISFMMRLVLFGALLLIVIGLLLLGISDASASVADSSIPKSNVTSVATEAEYLDYTAQLSG